VVLRADAVAAGMGAKAETRGSTLVAQFFTNRAQGVRLALIDATVGGIVVPYDGARLALCFTVAGERIVAVEAVVSSDDLAAMSIEILAG
jgi:RNA polymerase sigma-70 factor (ECF subfamily)